MNALALPPDMDARVLRNEPLAKHTSWRVGGPADLFFRPLDAEDLAQFLRQLDPEIPVLWIGLGSNLLVRDGGFPASSRSSIRRFKPRARLRVPPSAPNSQRRSSAVSMPDKCAENAPSAASKM